MHRVSCHTLCDIQESELTITWLLRLCMINHQNYNSSSHLWTLNHTFDVIHFSFACVKDLDGRCQQNWVLNSQWTNTSSSRFKTQRDTAICNQASQMNQSLNASKAMNLWGCVLGSGVAEFLILGDIGCWPISEHYQMPNEKPEQILGSLPASCPTAHHLIISSNTWIYVGMLTNIRAWRYQIACLLPSTACISHHTDHRTQVILTFSPTKSLKIFALPCFIKGFKIGQAHP